MLLKAISGEFLVFVQKKRKFRLSCFLIAKKNPNTWGLNLLQIGLCLHNTILRGLQLLLQLCFLSASKHMAYPGLFYLLGAKGDAVSTTRLWLSAGTVAKEVAEDLSVCMSI